MQVKIIIDGGGGYKILFGNKIVQENAVNVQLLRFVLLVRLDLDYGILNVVQHVLMGPILGIIYVKVWEFFWRNFYVIV